MSGKTWLWIGLGGMALISVCCIGVLIGGAIARQNANAFQTATSAITKLPTQEPGTASIDESPGPTLPPFTPTQQAPSPTQSPSPPLTATAVPIPPSPAAPPAAPPAGDELKVLVNYANAMQPLLERGTKLVERDGEILKASEGGNDAVLCDGRLAADNASMSDILQRARDISPPADAAVVHDVVLRSGDAWTEALDNVALFCDTGQQLYKIPAVLKFWEAAATLQDAANRFWLLLIAKGVEDWVQR